ncbi:MAG: helix-turn-helix domain-containing protein [Verrucomicrobiota bacterium]|nr:helix-turn-helix domain-containing protein [Verrucomicrobiota bacterium]
MRRPSNGCCAEPADPDGGSSTSLFGLFQYVCCVKPVFEQTPRAQWESFHYEVVRGAGYNAAWHFHPECHLTLVIKSCGHRLVGDHIAPLHAGDLVLVGSNLPHVWHQDPPRRGKAAHAVHAIVVRFLETFAGRDFLDIPEMEPVRRLLRRAARGLQVTGVTREIVAEKMRRLPDLAGLGRLSGLLSILHALARSRELRPLARPGFLPALDRSDEERMQRVCNYINARLAEPIDRGQIAREAHLSDGACSRFFKLRTGRTLPRYINELRVGRACRLLAEEDGKIADVALECGFRNPANFNRRFREIMRLTPCDYHRQIRRSADELNSR